MGDSTHLGAQILRSLRQKDHKFEASSASQWDHVSKQKQKAKRSEDVAPLDSISSTIKKRARKCDLWKMCKNVFNLLFPLISINIIPYLSDFTIDGKFGMYPDEYKESAIKMDFKYNLYGYAHTYTQSLKSTSWSTDVFSVVSEWRFLPRVWAVKCWGEQMKGISDDYPRDTVVPQASCISAILGW